jgi:hypothetical protein
MPWVPSVPDDGAILSCDESSLKAPVSINLARDRLRIANHMSDIAVRRLLLAGLKLESAKGLMDNHPAAANVEAAIDQVDAAIHDIRDILFDVRR